MTYLSTILQSFFTDYVHTQRSLSAHTIGSYRDTWRLLIKHITASSSVAADQIQLTDLDRDSVTTFLASLRDTRGNSAATRNHRLTAIRALLAYALPDHPEHADHIRQILAIRPSKTAKPELHYLNRIETDALLNAPDTTTWTGRRDQAMLTLTINTGLRISELIALETNHIHTGASPYVECQGKGRKHRSTPMTIATGDQMRKYLDERLNREGTALFPGPRGHALSRDAIERRLAVHLTSAARFCPSITAKHLTWHSLRHTSAMNLLHAGVDITVIALWLGHEQTTTTEIYLHHDMETKKNALEHTRPPQVEPGTYVPPADILAWLNNL